MQFDPKFEEGDFVLLRARSAKEGRLEERDAEGKFVSIPQKLRSDYVGPYEMIRWGAGKRSCTININGKEVSHNVNRLVKHHVWDEVHLSTDDKKLVAPKLREPPAHGELIIFPMAHTQDHNCPFGVGKVIDSTDPKNVKVQWLGSRPGSDVSKPFGLGWVDPKDNKGYYGRRLHYSHPLWTNEDTSTTVSTEMVILQGTDILNPANDKIATIHRDAIESALGVTVTWGK